jgi:hypothetical protein
VRYGVTTQFEHDRETELYGCCNRLLGRADLPLGGEGYAVLTQERFRG